jgi:hypothetical protein
MIRMSARLQILRKSWAVMQKNPLSRSGGPRCLSNLPQHHQACVKQYLPSMMQEVRHDLLQLQSELHHHGCPHGMALLSSLPPLTLSPVTTTTQGQPYGSAAWETSSQQSENELHGFLTASQHIGPPQLPETPNLPPMFPDGAFG